MSPVTFWLNINFKDIMLLEENVLLPLFKPETVIVPAVIVALFHF